MDFKQAKEIFNFLYQNINGYSISLNARSKLGYYDKALTYGEINFDTFYEIIERASPKKGDIFYDLGSGTGKAVMAGHLLFNFQKAVGIEILKDLYDCALSIKEKYEKEIKQRFLLENNCGEIKFILGDILKTNFLDGDIIFVNSTCFSSELMKNLEKIFLNLKQGTRIITLTNKLVTNNFQLIDSKPYRQSWGLATVNFYYKL